MNPVLPPDVYLCDVEARVFDGRLYAYGTTDTPGDTEYGSHSVRVFSTSDLRDWTDHGVILTSEYAPGGAGARIFAPDCVSVGGKYFLYFCTNKFQQGVAIGTSPAGPFSSVHEIEHAGSLDPALLVDDDDQVYYFWGQFFLRGGRLRSDMVSIDPSSIVEELLTEKTDGFHEGASVRKIGGVYYMVYTDIGRGGASCLSYATAESPLGPYTRRGVIVDNTGCDPDSWNNHGSIQKLADRWYVFYHRSSQGSRYNRRLCIEPINIHPDGSIREVEMTSQGPGEPLDARAEIPVFCACKLTGTLHSAVDYNDRVRNEYLSNISNGDTAAIKYVDFGAGVDSVIVTAASATRGGSVEIRLDSEDGPVAGSCIIDYTGGWSSLNEFRSQLDAPVSGVRAVYLKFAGGVGRLFDMDTIRFE